MFRLDPKPSFWLTVLIPEAGGEGQRMRAEFCYMTLEEYKAHFMVMARKPVAEFLTPGSIGEGGLLIGWATTDAEDGSYLGMPEAFSAEAVARLVNAFPRAGQALVDAYRAEMFTGVSPALGKLKAAARHYAGGGPPDEARQVREWVASLMQLGISEADARAYVGAPPPPPAEFGVWPENWPAVQVFMAMQTQWRRNAMTGRRED